ncbi:MAG TPA: glutaredoxin family protein [Actinomycetota bacterium]
MAEVVMYARPGCHLCDEAREVILGLRAELGFDYSEVDVEGDAELEREHGLRVPVVAVDGEEAFEYRVDVDELRRLLS